MPGRGAPRLTSSMMRSAKPPGTRPCLTAAAPTLALSPGGERRNRTALPPRVRRGRPRRVGGPGEGGVPAGAGPVPRGTPSHRAPGPVPDRPVRLPALRRAAQKGRVRDPSPPRHGVLRPGRVSCPTAWFATRSTSRASCDTSANSGSTRCSSPTATSGPKGGRIDRQECCAPVLFGGPPEADGSRLRIRSAGRRPTARCPQHAGPVHAGFLRVDGGRHWTRWERRLVCGPCIHRGSFV